MWGCGYKIMIDENTNILVVDDFPVIRRILKKILKGLGLTNIHEAEGGRDALRKLREVPVDLILLDWNMPDISGLEVLKYVRADEKLKRLPVIMVTAELFKEDVISAVQAGVNDYIAKPFTADTLEKKITSVLNSLPKMRFGEFLLEKGVVDSGQIQAAVDYQKKNQELFGELAVKLNMMDAGDLENALKAQTEMDNQEQIGEVAISLGFLNESGVKKILTYQKSTRPKLGEALIKLGHIGEEIRDKYLKEFQVAIN